MTDGRVKALEAVAEAARKFDREGGYFEAVRAALAALDEYTVAEAKAGKTVEVRVELHRSRNSGEWCPMMEGTQDEYELTDGPWDHLATLTAHVPLPVVPTIAATVTREATND